MAARRLDWTLGATYIGLMTLILIINFACLALWNPVLLGRRFGLGAGTKAWDIVWLAFFAPLMIAIFVVPVYEAGTKTRPDAAWLVGAALFGWGWALVIWAMVVNPFFEKTVRIQTEHAHRVVEAGPYAYVPHPGYVGFAGWAISTPLLLGSVWGFVPAVLSIIAFVIRTVLEDRTLQAELPGYAEYALRVRFRLIPGVW